MLRVYIDGSCVDCGVCNNFCDEGAIYYNYGQGHYQIDMGSCSTCCSCIDVCSVNAIHTRDTDNI